MNNTPPTTSNKEDEELRLELRKNIQPLRSINMVLANELERRLLPLIKSRELAARKEENNMYITDTDRHYFPAGINDPYIPIEQFHERIEELNKRRKE